MLNPETLNFKLCGAGMRPSRDRRGREVQENKDFKMSPGAIKPEEHLGLVYKISRVTAKRYGGEQEEYYAEAYLALLAAIRTYNPEKSRFSTHAVTTMRWKLFTNQMHSMGYKKAGKAEYWYKPEMAGGDMIIDLVSRDKEVSDPPMWFNWLDEEEQELVTMRARGMTLQELSEEFGVSKERIRQRFIKIGRALAEKYPETVPKDWKHLSVA